MSVEYSIVMGVKWEHKHKDNSRSKYVARKILKDLKKNGYTVRKTLARCNKERILIIVGTKEEDEGI